MEMARSKGAKYFDVTSVSHFTKKILDQLSFKGRYFSNIGRTHEHGLMLGSYIFLNNRTFDKFQKVIYSLPYADYKENGECLFINIPPENDTCYFMAAKL